MAYSSTFSTFDRFGLNFSAGISRLTPDSTWIGSGGAIACIRWKYPRSAGGTRPGGSASSRSVTRDEARHRRQVVHDVVPIRLHRLSRAG